MAAPSPSRSPRKARERPIEERFEKAVSVIRSLPPDGPYQPSNMVKLKFYALYKQAREGPNTSPKPGFWDPTARAKWEAWTQCGNTSKQECMRMYVEELQRMVETMPHSKQVEDFLVSIGPFYEAVDNKEEEEEEKEEEEEEGNTKSSLTDGDSTEDDEFLDSIGDLSSVEDQKRALGAVSLSPSREDSLLNTSATGGRIPVKRSVQFADNPDSRVVSNSQEDSTTLTMPSAQALSNMLASIQQHIQSLQQQLTRVTSSVQSIEQQLSLSQVANGRHRVRGGGGGGSRRRALVMSVVCPLVLNLAISYFAKRYSSVALPGWLWRLLTACHIVLSLSLVYQQH